MLSGWTGAILLIACQRCGRRDSYIKADVLTDTGDIPLTDLLKRLTADCPRAGETAIYELCGARSKV